MLTIAGASFHAMAQQPQATLDYAEELLALAEEHEMVGFRGWANFFCGWAHTVLGKQPSGLEQMTMGWEHLQATNTQGSLPQLSVLLAEAYMRSGKNPESAATLKKAHKLATMTETSSHLAEIYRLQGKVCQTIDPTEAEDCFLQAIEVAQAQEAKLWELRATVDLARLWQTQGRAAEGNARLAALYDWFTEGFDTPDLTAAQSQLAVLGKRGA
jgi:predicted ATPase